MIGAQWNDTFLPTRSKTTSQIERNNTHKAAWPMLSSIHDFHWHEPPTACISRLKTEHSPPDNLPGSTFSPAPFCWALGHRLPVYDSLLGRIKARRKVGPHLLASKNCSRQATTHLSDSIQTNSKRDAGALRIPKNRGCPGTQSLPRSQCESGPGRF